MPRETEDHLETRGCREILDFREPQATVDIRDL